jgi:hypothetical protein
MLSLTHSSDEQHPSEENIGWRPAEVAKGGYPCICTRVKGSRGMTADF